MQTHGTGQTGLVSTPRSKSDQPRARVCARLPVAPRVESGRGAAARGPGAAVPRGGLPGGRLRPPLGHLRRGGAGQGAARAGRRLPRSLVHQAGRSGAGARDQGPGVGARAAVARRDRPAVGARQHSSPRPRGQPPLQADRQVRRRARAARRLPRRDQTQPQDRVAQDAGHCVRRGGGSQTPGPGRFTMKNAL